MKKRELRLENRFPKVKTDENRGALRKIKQFRELESINRFNQQNSNIRSSSSSSHLTIAKDSHSNLSDPTLIIKSLNDFKIKISHVKSFGHFYAHLDLIKFEQSLASIEKNLNDERNKLFNIQRKDLFVGKLVCCPHSDERHELRIYRAKILDVKSDHVKVILVDYGFTEKKDYALIFMLNEELAKIPFHVRYPKIS